MTRLASLVLVVRDLEHALAVYEQGLGFARVGEPSDVPSLGARHVFLRAENCLLELVQPHDERSPPGLFLRQRGEGMFAMELRVDDPAQAREHLAHASVQTPRSEEHTSELQSLTNLVCRLLLEKKKTTVQHQVQRLPNPAAVKRHIACMNREPLDARPIRVADLASHNNDAAHVVEVERVTRSTR